MPGPLENVRVVEMAGIGPGPFCAMMLADMGAEVIRVQGKSGGDSISVLNSKFDVLARGRRSMSIDLKKPGGSETILKLIESADALIEGYRPGVMERLGLGPDVCLARNPRLVFGRMTGWGQTGPLANAAGHDLNYISISGALHGIGNADTPPVVPLNVVGDFGGGGMLLAFGILCALLEARSSGKGQVVDAAMTDGSAILTSMIYGFKAAGGWTNQRGMNLLDGGAHFYGTYECADGKSISVGAIEPQFYKLLLEITGVDGDEFSAQMDAARWPELKSKFAKVIRTKTRDEWAHLLEGTDACSAPILDWDEAPRHPHNIARETFIEIDGVIQPAPAPRFSRTQPSKPTAPARANQHTDEILKDWGVDVQKIVELKKSGAI